MSREVLGDGETPDPTTPTLAPDLDLGHAASAVLTATIPARPRAQSDEAVPGPDPRSLPPRAPGSDRALDSEPDDEPVEADLGEHVGSAVAGAPTAAADEAGAAGDADDPSRPRGSRAPRLTVVSIVVASLVLGLVAGYEEAQRAQRRAALRATTLFAWINTDDVTYVPSPSGGTTQFTLKLAVTGVQAVTVSRLLVPGTAVALVTPTRLEPGQLASAVATAPLMTCSGSLDPAPVVVEGDPTAQASARVTSDSGDHRTVSVRLPSLGFVDMLRSFACGGAPTQDGGAPSRRCGSSR